MAEEMSSSAWVLMDDGCSECGGPPPLFHLPPPPLPQELCDLEMTCPNILNVSDAEYKRIGSFPSVTVIVCCTLLSFVILLVIAALVWKYVRIKKKRKGVTQSKDFDHHGPTMMNGNGVLYEDLTHAIPRPPIAPPSIEMMDVSHHRGIGNPGMMANSKLDFSYFLNPPPIYEELPDHSDRNQEPSDDEFAEDELSVIDVPGAHDISEASFRYQTQQHPSSGRSSSKRAQSLTRKRPSRSSSGGSGPNGSAIKSQRSLDRRARNNLSHSGAILGKYGGSATNPRGYSKHLGMDESNMLILSNPNNGMTMKIPPHLVAVLTESCNGGARPYEVIPTSLSGGHVMSANPSSLVVGNGVLVNGAGINGGVYQSSRSSGSSYGEGGSSSSSARINPGGNSIESSSFDSGIGPHSIASFINSPAYDQGMAPMNAYEYATSGQSINPSQYLNSQQLPSFRRLRMTAADREHPLYSNHLLT